MSGENRIVFIDKLRAIATIFVLLGHFCFVFWYNNAAVASLLHIEERGDIILTIPRIYGDIAIATEEAKINLGMIGVGLFFLISGFVIPYSVKNRGGSYKILFLIKRFLRIWPVYIVGFGVTFVSLEIYGRVMSGDWLFSVKDYLLQASLLRDFFEIPSLDGISWTLEIELKFYILFFILYILKCEDNPKVITGIAVVVLIIQVLWNDANANAIYLLGEKYYFFGCVFVNASMYMIFILMGLSLYQLYSSKWDLKIWAVVEQVLLVCFLAAIPHSSLEPLRDKIIINYGISLALFLNMYMLRRTVTHNKVTKFFADNSFSIYILHGVNGYILLTIFYDVGIPMYINLSLVIMIVLTVSWLFHQYVEKPIGQLAKKYIIARFEK